VVSTAERVTVKVAAVLPLFPSGRDASLIDSVPWAANA